MLENDTAFFIFAIKVVHRLKRKTISEANHILFECIQEEFKYFFFQYRYYYGMDIFRASISVLRTRIYSNEFIR